MRIMRCNVICMCLLFITQLCISQENRHGLVLNGGLGKLNDVVPVHENLISEEARFKYNLGLGYKVRIYNFKKPFFYDFDFSIGMKKCIYDYHNKIYDPDINPDPINHYVSEDIKLYYTSFNPTINYKIYRNLFLGVGLEPTIYYKANTSIKFDSPATFKIGYDHKFIGWAFIYKYGLFNTLDISDNISKGKMNDVAVQLFIHF